jgi:16S rRNA (uracil1498-N3)-methyltransferase
MKYNRIYRGIPLLCDTEITLDAGATHHLTSVLRCRINDRIELFNGDGCSYTANIREISNRQTVVRILSQSTLEADPLLDIHLGLPLSKGRRMDFALQKAVELGVSAITPLKTEHTAVKLPEKRLQQKQQHWRQVIISACEQSGRCRLPPLHPLTTLDAWAQQKISYGIVLDPQADNSLTSLPAPAEKTMQQFTLARLGPRVLRTETATIVAVSMAQMLWGDMK